RRALLRPRHFDRRRPQPDRNDDALVFLDRPQRGCAAARERSPVETGLAQRNEILFERGFRATPSSNYNPGNPASVVSPTTVDPDLMNDTTDEAIVSLDRGVMATFGVGISYISRRYGNFQETYRNGVLSATYAPVSFTRPCGNALCDEPS